MYQCAQYNNGFETYTMHEAHYAFLDKARGFTFYAAFDPKNILTESHIITLC